MYYRKLTDITDEEVKFIINYLFTEDDIFDIKRDEVNNEVTAVIKTTFESYNPDGVSENIDFFDDVKLTVYDIEHPFNESPTDRMQWLYQQYLVAKGCHPLFENNPFID